MRWVGECEKFTLDGIGQKCPRRNDGTKISEKCKDVRFDCLCYVGTIKARPNYGGGGSGSGHDYKGLVCSD